MWIKRALETAAMFMIGDGLLATVEPRRHCMLWKMGPAVCQDLMESFIEHPGMTRVVGGVELALGLWLASKQRPSGPMGMISSSSSGQPAQAIREEVMV